MDPDALRRRRRRGVSWGRRFLAMLPALGLGAAGGALFAALGMPLAWTLGALFACLGAAVSGVRLTSPLAIRPVMAMVLGLGLGGAFSPALLDRMVVWWPSLLMVIPYIILSGLLGSFYFRRIVGYDPATAYFTSMPGGLSEMVLLGAQAGADERAIALVHAARIMLTVIVLPLGFSLAGAIDPGAAAGPRSFAAATVETPLWHLPMLLAAGLMAWRLAARLKLPAAPLMGPMLVSAALHLGGVTAVQVPPALLATAQVVIGASIGCRFIGMSAGMVLRLTLQSIPFVGLILGIAGLLSLVIPLWTGVPGVAVILAFAPGGLIEMGLLALVLGVDAAYVATHHLARLVTVLLLAPPGQRLMLRAPAPNDPARNPSAGNDDPPPRP